MTGSVQMAKASYYIREDLRDAGLVPMGENGGWFQFFEVEMPPVEGNSVMQIGSTYYSQVGTVAASADKTHSANLVGSASGLVDGQFVLLRYRPGDKLRGLIREATDAGAIGVVVGTNPSDVDENFDGMIQFKSAQGKLSVPVVTVTPQLWGALEEKVTQAGPDGITGVTLMPQVIREIRTARNIMALAPGTSGEVIVVGAHYDHLGFGGEGSLAPGVHAIHNGADDNASGTAMVLELAEMWGLSHVGPQPRERGILFCLWSGEEMGLLGSAHWVANPTIPLENVVCNVNLDMVGRMETGKITVASASTAAAFGPALEHAQQFLSEQGFDLELDVMQTDMPGGGGSDHMSFHKVGIPAVFFFSGMHSDYHRPSDDWQKLTYGRMAELGAGLADLLVRLQMAPRSDFQFQKPEASTSAHGGGSRRGGGLWFGSIPDYGNEPEGGGMALSGTSPGSPAEKAGLLPGDVLKKVGDVEIGDIYDFMDALGKFKVGDTVTVAYLREGSLESTELTFFPRP
ncbi:MAG: M28 family peptidase [Planctomycetota bacterium]|nr:M28 family peptidase [Planctomycetota bacterium]